MQSGARMALIDGDLESALEWTAARVRRYGSKYAIRDLQQILHITGRSDFAWSVFDQGLSNSKRYDSQLWSGALVGHRVASATTADLVKWIEASELRRKSFIRRGDSLASIQLAQRYLLLSGITDRAPSTELSDAIEKFRLDRPATYFFMQEPDPEQPPPALRWRGWVLEDGRTFSHDDMIPTPAHGQKAKSRELIDSRYEMIADAMSAFLAGDHEKSFELFNETAYYYNLEEFLAYYAFSASAIGNADHLSAALAAREPAFQEIENNVELGSVELGYRFNEDLTYAVLESSKGRHEAALKYLKQALNNRPYIEDRAIYPYYQIADMADRMFENTGVREYREFSLDLARRHTVVLPMYSWAYFIVAKYSDTEVERIKATASGLALDPLSFRATKLPKELVEDAKAYRAKHGAPYKNRNAGSEPAST